MITLRLVYITLLYIASKVSSEVMELMLMLSNEFDLLCCHLFLCILIHNAVAHRSWLSTICLDIIGILLTHRAE